VADLTSLVLIFPDDDNAVLPFFWTTRASVNRREEKHLLPSYAAWEREGHLGVCEGDWIDQDEILDEIRRAAERFDLRDVAFDRWNSAKAMTELAKDNIDVVQFGQGYASLSEPSKELERLVLSGGLCHGGHPVLRWNAGNVMVITDGSPAENIKPVKTKTKDKARKQDDNKIDGIVALVMAIGRAIADDNGPSIYETRGILTL
jgi:phage terminase large subunit-like protein